MNLNDPRNYKQLYQETLTLCENREHDIKGLQLLNRNLQEQNSMLRQEKNNLRQELDEIKGRIQRVIDLFSKD